jgi:hypothetical protein
VIEAQEVSFADLHLETEGDNIIRFIGRSIETWARFQQLRYLD